jgi:hypothetical protein
MNQTSLTCGKSLKEIGNLFNILTLHFMSLQEESSKIQKILQTIGKLIEQNELSSLVGIGLNLENIFVPNEGNSKLIFLEETFERFQTWRFEDLDRTVKSSTKLHGNSQKKKK